MPVQLQNHARQSAESPTKRPPPSPPTSAVTALAISTTTSHLLTAHEDNDLAFWTSSSSAVWTLKTVFKSPHEKGTICKAAFAPATLHPCATATVCTAGVAMICAPQPDLSTLVVHECFKLQSQVHDVAFSEAGLLAVLCTDGATVIFQSASRVDLSSWRLLTSVDVPRSPGLTFAPAGTLLLAAGALLAQQRASPWCWDVVSQLPVDEIVAADWSAAGFLAVASGGPVVTIWRLVRCEPVRIADLTVLKPSASLDETSVSVVDLAWDRSGAVLAVVDNVGSISLFGRRMCNGAWKWELRAPSPG